MLLNFHRLVLTPNLEYLQPIASGELGARGEVKEMKENVNEILVQGVLMNDGRPAARCEAVIARISKKKIKKY